MQTLTLQAKNNKLFCYFVGVLCIFFIGENLNFESQTKKPYCKNYPRIKNCVRRRVVESEVKYQTSSSDDLSKFPTPDSDSLT